MIWGQLTQDRDIISSLEIALLSKFVGTFLY